MRRNVKNDKVLRAISIGLATMIAVSSTPVNVFAEGGENGGTNQEQPGSQTSVTDAVVQKVEAVENKVAEEIKEITTPASGQTENPIKAADSDTQNSIKEFDATVKPAVVPTADGNPVSPILVINTIVSQTSSDDASNNQEKKQPEYTYVDQNEMDNIETFKKTAETLKNQVASIENTKSGVGYAEDDFLKEAKDMLEGMKGDIKAAGKIEEDAKKEGGAIDNANDLCQKMDAEDNRVSNDNLVTESKDAKSATSDAITDIRNAKTVDEVDSIVKKVGEQVTQAQNDYKTKKDVYDDINSKYQKALEELDKIIKEEYEPYLTNAGKKRDKASGYMDKTQKKIAEAQGTAETLAKQVKEAKDNALTAAVGYVNSVKEKELADAVAEETRLKGIDEEAQKDNPTDEQLKSLADTTKTAKQNLDELSAISAIRGAETRQTNAHTLGWTLEEQKVEDDTLAKSLLQYNVWKELKESISSSTEEGTVPTLPECSAVSISDPVEMTILDSYGDEKVMDVFTVTYTDKDGQKVTRQYVYESRFKNDSEVASLVTSELEKKNWGWLEIEPLEEAKNVEKRVKDANGTYLSTEFSCEAGKEFTEPDNAIEGSIQYEDHFNTDGSYWFTTVTWKYYHVGRGGMIYYDYVRDGSKNVYKYNITHVDMLKISSANHYLEEEFYKEHSSYNATEGILAMGAYNTAKDVEQTAKDNRTKAEGTAKDLLAQKKTVNDLKEAIKIYAALDENNNLTGGQVKAKDEAYGKIKDFADKEAKKLKGYADKSAEIKTEIDNLDATLSGIKSSNALVAAKAMLVEKLKKQLGDAEKALESSKEILDTIDEILVEFNSAAENRKTEIYNSNRVSDSKDDPDDDVYGGGDEAPGEFGGYSGFAGSASDLIALTPVGGYDEGTTGGNGRGGRRGGAGAQDRGVAGVRVEDNNDAGKNTTNTVAIKNTNDDSKDSNEQKLTKVETPEKPLAATPFKEDPVNPAIVGISIASLLAVLAGLYYKFNRRKKAKAEEMKKYKKD